MIGQTDGLESTKVVSVLLFKAALETIEIYSTLVRKSVGNQIKEGIDKDRPKNAP